MITQNCLNWGVQSSIWDIETYSVEKLFKLRIEKLLQWKSMLSLSKTSKHNQFVFSFFNRPVTTNAQIHLRRSPTTLRVSNSRSELIWPFAGCEHAGYLALFACECGRNIVEEREGCLWPVQLSNSLVGTGSAPYLCRRERNWEWKGVRRKWAQTRERKWFFKLHTTAANVKS